MDILEIIKAVVIGVVEGITEWLPISSTGHMIIVDEFIKLDVSTGFWEMFLVVIQLGAILAVILLYFKKLNPFAPSKGREGRRKTWLLWAKVVVGCIPAACIGILLDDWFTEHFHNAITVAIALVMYGIAFIVIERVKGSGKGANSNFKKSADGLKSKKHKARAVRGRHSPEALAARGGTQQKSVLEHAAEKAHKTPKKQEGGDAVATVDELGFGRALGIGAFQCLAIIPGTSRSGSTILGGRILGVSREAAAEFSFFLAIPVMFGWSLLKLVKGFVFDSVVLTTNEWAVFASGTLVAFVVSILAIKFLMSYIRRHSFEVFGWYRIVLGVVVLLFFAATGQLFIVQ